MIARLFFFLRKVWSNLIHFPIFLYLYVKDLILYFIHKEYENFNGFGIHLYTARFGSGKTCSMVTNVYKKCKQYKKLKLLTNIHVKNFPKHTEIIQLNSIDDIINCEENTIIMVDEIGTIFNSRDFSKGKSVPKVLFQYLCQVRHRHIELHGTAQRWHFVDKQIRDITTDVRVVSSYSGLFRRAVNYYVYDASDYELSYNNPNIGLVPIGYNFFIMSDKVRSRYDTFEMVEGDLDTDIYNEADDTRSFIAPGTDRKAKSGFRATKGRL